MIETILIVVVLVIVALLAYAATRPDSFRVQRAISIDAPAEKIFPLLDDFRRWEAWSPWEKCDPEVKRTYSGAASGKGAVYEWSGNKNLGQGRIEIVESMPPSKLLLKIDFIKPFKACNTIEFTLEQHGDATTVTEAMYGPSPFISKLMEVFCSMDKMIGQKYEESLAGIKAIAEQ